MAVKVMIVLNTAWNLVNFRSGLIRAMIRAGHDVVAVAPADDYAIYLPALGCRYIAMPMDNKGTNPAKDLFLFFRFLKLLRRERPNVFLGFTIKPNVYGSLAAHILGIPVVNNIAGLGTIFTHETWITCLVRKMYYLALSRSAKVFFQNEEDRTSFIESGLVRPAMTDRLPGSGVDLQWFSPKNITVMSSTHVEREEKDIRFILIARMLWDKGVGEYIEASRIIKHKYPHVTFSLLGFLDVENPTTIRRQEMTNWVTEGIVEYLGVSDDIRPHILDANCVVLPSYREGLPRVLLEAAAMERPIVATDVIGCRDVVEHGINGLLCRPRDAIDLANKLEQMITLTPEERSEMGRKGRIKVEAGFSEERVITKYLEIIELILSK